ncbi:PFGI-1 class ICE element type IV pilus protein PilL2 [Cupriavidus sp. IDO]|uniref:PFGI-1 class ICE element type IV pilus protein PilL2 n=1 Tax=Cupriavidus sp. IDO TaxID=1539142 RepID=UPI00068AB62D|nr:PilL N-terminal domain-containing protein [Cupriavidus sp. IDO]KWR90188.1 hypothetical protein RM96_10875 [Cupriavidus sp. IDO]
MRLSAYSLPLAGLAGAILITGCATTVPPADLTQTPGPPEQSQALISGTNTPGAPVPVVRYGRYTLTELVAEPGQRELMKQVVDITIPPSLDSTVGDAMRHVLQRSGYRLCEGSQAVMLYALPLPAAHLRLGPMVLRDALLTLAGPAWDMAVDETSRQVCFKHAVAPVTPTPTAPALDRAESVERIDTPEG